jgi:hypothetical protein
MPIPGCPPTRGDLPCADREKHSAIPEALRPGFVRPASFVIGNFARAEIDAVIGIAKANGLVPGDRFAEKRSLIFSWTRLSRRGRIGRRGGGDLPLRNCGHLNRQSQQLNAGVVLRAPGFTSISESGTHGNWAVLA